MARPRLPIGAHGRIATKETPPGSRKWRATARFRDFDGTTRQVEAWAESSGKAERKLIADMATRQRIGGQDVTPDLPIKRLAALWLEEKKDEGIEPQTLDQYHRAVDKLIVPRLGGLEIREATVSRLDAYLKRLKNKTPAQARIAKVCLSGMLGLAVRHEAIAHNPVRDTARLKTNRAKPRAAADDEVQRLREALRLWESDLDPETGEPLHRGGRPRSKNLCDVMDIALATGAQLGEVLALRWLDVDLDASPATVTIAGTVVQIKGQGLVWKDRPKTDAGWRTVRVPSWAADTLRRLESVADRKPDGLVFPSSVGTPLSPANYRTRLRSALKGTGLEWIKPHTMRKTVGTVVSDEHSTKAASNILGHSGTTVTETHYIAKPAIAPDASGTLERLAPDLRSVNPAARSLGKLNDPGAPERTSRPLSLTTLADAT